MQQLGANLDFILYLEGVPVPFLDATIVSSVGSPANANISIPPTTKSQNVTARTSVHLFYLDPRKLYDDSAPQELVGKPVYNLLFEGEVVSVRFEKRENNRATILSCIDHTNNFDYAHKFTIENIPDLATSVKSRFTFGAQQTVELENDLSNIFSSPIANLVGGSDNIAEGVKSLIESTFRLATSEEDELSTNDFLSSVQERFKISERIAFISDAEIERLIRANTAIKLLQRNVGRHPPTITLSMIIQDYLNFVYYNLNSILSPSYNNGNIQSIILSPNIYFSPPPRCNVIFPSQVRNIGYTENFLMTPTRLLLTSTPIGFPEVSNPLMISNIYAAPRELSTIANDSGSNALSRRITSEELLKGVIPVSKTLGVPEYVVELGERREEDDDATYGKQLDSGRNYLLNIAEYELEIRRAATRQIDSMTGPFNPGAIVGLPAVVLDEIAFIFGMMGSVSHSISGREGGGASTTYNIQLSRRVVNNFETPNLTEEQQFSVDFVADILRSDLNASDANRVANSESLATELKTFIDALNDLNTDERIIDILRRIVDAAPNERDSLILQYLSLIDSGIYENLPETPRWINSAYNFDNAGETYKSLYGCESMVDPVNVGGSTERFGSMAEAAKFALDNHRAAQDQFRFVSRYTKRSTITTQEDFNEFYGLPTLSGTDKAYPPQGPFTATRQAVILDYVRELNSSRGHLG